MDSKRFVTGSKTFEITDYSIAKSVGKMNYIQSERFTVGGYNWVIEFYPQGESESVSDHVSVFVQLLSTTKEVQAMYSIRLRDWTTSKWSTTTPTSSNLITFSSWNGSSSWGCNTYIKRSVLEASNYLKDDTRTPHQVYSLGKMPRPRARVLDLKADYDKRGGTNNDWNPCGVDIYFDNRNITNFYFCLLSAYICTLN